MHPTLVEQGVAIAEVFETAQPYSARTVDSLDLAEFFATRPEYRSDSASLVDFYGRRAMQFAWIVNDSLSASAEAFIALAGVAEGAAPPTSSLASKLGALYEEGLAARERIPLCDSCVIGAELLLTAEFFRFADRDYNGYLSRNLRDLNWFIPRAKKDVTRLLDSLAVGKLDLSAYEPIHPQYQLLKAGIRASRELADAPWPALKLPSGIRTLEAGDSVALVGAIRHRLHLLGDLLPDGTHEDFDSTLVLAVQGFQRRHGLTADGIVGPAFLRAINTRPAARLRTMLVNMERLRWVPERQPPNLLLVNIPEFRLHVLEGDQEVMTMEVVVGARATRTVIFSDSVSQVVFSPTWTVPASITRNEILPAIRRNPDYLRLHDMEIIGGSAAAPLIRQKPGPANALGRVKFVFPNSYSIYMHDTPATSLFGIEQRALSHGCIRVSRPRELAEYLLRDDPAWPPQRIAQAMNGGRETFVPLKEKRPVVIVYFTAWVDREGQLNFRDDVYGHDARLASELFLGPDSVAGVALHSRPREN
jgi:murein L,D-transpeptidase YcbB/YkuD